MAGKPFGFCGPTYQGRSLNANAERAINLYPEFDPRRQKWFLYGTPGHTTLATLPKSPVRGVWGGDNVIYAVGGDSLYKVTLGGVVSLEGALNSATTPAKIFSNGNQLMIVSGDEVFVADGVSVTKVLEDGYVSGTFIDGYFIVLRNPTATNGVPRDQVEISGLFDGATWDPLDIQGRNGSSDRLVGLSAHNQQLWLHGQEVSEAWWNNPASPNFPFERINGSQIEMGGLPWTIAHLDHSLFYVGTNQRGGGIVYRTEGFLPRRISNHSVEAALLNIGPVNIPIGYSYQELGHQFYVLCLPTATWVYDVATDMWHERATWTGSAWGPHDAVCAAHLNEGTVITGSGSSGKVYIQSMDAFTYSGTAIRRYRQAPHINESQTRITHEALQLDLEVGTQGSGTPTALLRYSKDGAHSFSADKTVNLAAVGDYSKRAIWRRLGSSRQRTYGVTLPDLTTGPVCIVDAYLSASGTN